MVFFIADTHFGHKNILTLCDRPYGTIEEMNADFISRWNAKVTGNDTVFVLGDLFFRAENVTDVLASLKGKKHLLIGNHDGHWMSKVNLSQWFKSVSLMQEISNGSVGFTLCHYPMLTWKHAKRTYMVHGHIHKNRSMEFWPLLRANPNILNAGVDINNYEPVSFEELLRNNERFKNEQDPKVMEK